MTPEKGWVLIHATMLIGDLMEKGFIEGPFEVNMDGCRGALLLLKAEHDFEPPTHEESVEQAIKLVNEAHHLYDEPDVEPEIEEKFRELLTNEAEVRY